MKEQEILANLHRIIATNTNFTTWTVSTPHLVALVQYAIKEEREALEAELLKLKQGVAANSEYIQGRWDLIGEFQDIIRARRNT